MNPKFLHAARSWISMTALGLAGLAVTFFAISLSAQQGVRVGGPTARMTVSAETRSGTALPSITLKDVRVTEGRGKDLDPVVSWIPAQGDHAGLELLVAIDDGSSWDLGTHLNELRTFIQEQPATTLIGVGYMRYGMVEMAQNFTADHAAASKALRMPMGIAGFSGSPYFALQDLMKHWPANNMNPRHEVLLITSGIDPYYSGGLMNPYVAQAISDLQRGDVVVYSIYEPGSGHAGHNFWRINMGQSYLSEVSEETGGESYYIGIAPAVSFSPYLVELTHQLQHQYLLAFTPKPQKKSGLQPVHVSTELSGFDLVAADKVYVPAPTD